MNICFWQGAVTSCRRIACRQQPFFRTTAAVHENNVFREHWSVWMDSNHRPRAYQARALATWATDRYSLGGHWFVFIFATLRIQSLAQKRDPIARFLLSWSGDWVRHCRWWRWRESNPWPPACRAGALPAELHPHKGLKGSLAILKNWTARASCASTEQLVNRLNLFPNTEVFLRTLPDSP